MCGYSHGHVHSSTLAAGAISVLHSISYMVKPGERAKRTVETHKSGNVDFAKNFWNLVDTTAARHLGKVVAPMVACNCVLHLPIDSEELTGHSRMLLRLCDDDSESAPLFASNVATDAQAGVSSSPAQPASSTHEESDFSSLLSRDFVEKWLFEQSEHLKTVKVPSETP